MNLCIIDTNYILSLIYKYTFLYYIYTRHTIYYLVCRYALVEFVLTIPAIL